MTNVDTADGEGEPQRRLRRMIDLRGLTRVSAELGVSRESLARYLAGLDVLPGTLALIAARLAALGDAPPPPDPRDEGAPDDRSDQRRRYGFRG